MLVSLDEGKKPVFQLVSGDYFLKLGVDAENRRRDGRRRALK